MQSGSSVIKSFRGVCSRALAHRRRRDKSRNVGSPRFHRSMSFLLNIIQICQGPRPFSASFFSRLTSKMCSFFTCLRLYFQSPPKRNPADAIEIVNKASTIGCLGVGVSIRKRATSRGIKLWCERPLPFFIATLKCISPYVRL